MEKFHSFSITHKGSKHEGDVPCQDASAHLDLDGATMAIVADGHGSTRCFRSDIGSNKAVEATKLCVADFLKKTKKLNETDSRFDLSETVKQIINKWFVAVMRDEEEHPLKDDKRLEGIVQKYKDRYINDVDYRCHAYGTTLMVAVMGENYWFGFQVGDGKCVVLYEDGSWDLPIPWDDNCTFNTTTSICDDDSLSRFRYWFGFGNDKGTFAEYGYGVNGDGKDYIRENKSRPLAIFVGSDGVEDSYPRIDNDKYVINFYRNRIVSLSESGYDAFNEEIDGLAKRFADRESTDDVSIAGIVSDFVGKEAMIAKMKRDSAKHEAEIIYSEKRRDADEKKDALDTVQKRTDAITANQRKHESRVSSVENEVITLTSKMTSLESALAKGKAEIEASDRTMMDYQNKLRELKRDKSIREHDEQIISAKITIAEDDERKAKKAFDNAEKEYVKRKNALRKKKEAYDKYLQKLAAGTSQSSVAVQIQKIVTQTTVIYDAKGNVTNQVAIQLPSANPTHQTHLPINSVVADVKAEGLKQEIEKTTVELQDFQAQTVAARQSVESKSRELSSLHQQLFEGQQRTRQFEAEIKRIAQDLHTVEMQNRNQREVVRQLQNDIADTERNIRTKQAEINKLNAELEALKEQTKKQTDTLAQIKAAWEKAEAEAQTLEATIKCN